MLPSRLEKVADGDDILAKRGLRHPFCDAVDPEAVDYPVVVVCPDGGVTD